MVAIATSDSSLLEERSLDFRVVENLSEFEHPSSLLGGQFSEALVEVVIGLVEFDSGLRIHCLTTPDTQRLTSGRVTSTSRALERSNWIGFLIGDVDSVEPGEFPITLLSKHRNVSRGDTASADPTVVFFDVSLVQVPAGKKGRGGFPEVRQRNGFGDVSTIRSLVENLRHHPIGDRLGLDDLRPKRCIRITPVGMGLEPAIDVVDRRDQHDRSAALFALDGDLEAVVVVLDIADLEVLKLTSTETGIELEGDHCSVARVEALLEHRFDVLVPFEHVSRVGGRIVVIRRPGRNPLDGFGRSVATSDALREHTESRPVIPVRLLVIIASVDPRDDRLCSVTVFESGRESSLLEFLGHDSAVSEKLLVSVVAVFLGEQVETIAELQQEVTVAVGDLVAGVGALAENVDSISRCRGHEQSISLDCVKNLALNLGFTALLWLPFIGSNPILTDFVRSVRRFLSPLFSATTVFAVVRFECDFSSTDWYHDRSNEGDASRSSACRFRSEVPPTLGDRGK